MTRNHVDTTGAALDDEQHTITFEFEPDDYKFLIEQGITPVTQLSVGIPSELAQVDDTAARFHEFIDRVWELARKGTLGDWDYPVQVLRHLEEAMQAKDEQIRRLTTSVDDLQSGMKDERISQLTAWVNDLQSGMFINCVYCGHRYGPGETTPVTMADALKEHIEQCTQHPMSQLKAENARLQEKNKQLQTSNDDLLRMIGSVTGNS